MFGNLFGKPKKPTEYKDQPDRDTKKESRALEHLNFKVSLEDKNRADEELDNNLERHSLFWIESKFLQIRAGLLSKDTDPVLPLFTYFLERLRTLLELKQDLVKISDEPKEKQKSEFEDLDVKQRLFDIDLSSKWTDFTKVENLPWILRFINDKLLDSLIQFKKEMPIKYEEMMKYADSHNLQN